MKLISKLENNVIAGVLIKKGKNEIEDAVYNTLCKDKHFARFVKNGYIVKETGDKPENKFESMTYDELKQYVKDNNIEVPSLKKADILKVLSELSELSEKGE